MAEKLSALPLFSQRVRLEHAINRALDAANWPPTIEQIRERELGRGPALALSPLGVREIYVTVHTRYGDIRGHVGPFTSDQLAEQCARSWSSTGCKTEVVGYPVGPSMTNAY